MNKVPQSTVAVGVGRRYLREIIKINRAGKIGIAGWRDRPRPCHGVAKDARIRQRVAENRLQEFYFAFGYPPARLCGNRERISAAHSSLAPASELAKATVTAPPAMTPPAFYPPISRPVCQPC